VGSPDTRRSVLVREATSLFSRGGIDGPACAILQTRQEYEKQPSIATFQQG
jgi:hypothetical protein